MNPLLIIVFLVLGLILCLFLILNFLRKPSVEDEVKRCLDIYVLGYSTSSKKYQSEAIERGYGEMYNKEIDPDKHPGLTVPSFRWIEPKEFIRQEHIKRRM